MIHSFKISSVFLGIIMFIFMHSAKAEEQISTLQDQKMVSVTIYNDNLALIKDRRKVSLSKGMTNLAFREVSGRMKPETALLRSIENTNGVAVLEQNFDYDLLTPQKMLEKYVGQEVGVVKTHPTTGEETIAKALVLSTNEGVILKIGDHIETGIPGRLIFSSVPKNLRDRPTLSMTLESITDQPQTLELSYLSEGLAWKADYVAELNPDDTSIDLNGWVTLTNTSGTVYNNALLQLVAGDVHQAPRPVKRLMLLEREDASTAGSVSKMQEEDLFEYHLYTLPRPTSIFDNQTKQVALLQASQITSRKEYLLRGQQHYYFRKFHKTNDKVKIGVFLTFINSKEDNLGIPMPKGVVRVYKRDTQDRLQFIGEDTIDHTPKNETIRLKLGNAFDVTGQKRQTDFKKLSGFGRYNYVFESSYQIEIKNAKDKEVKVKILEQLPGDWEILSESHQHKKEAAFTAYWLLPVPAKGSSTLEYSVRVRQ